MISTIKNQNIIKKQAYLDRKVCLHVWLACKTQLLETTIQISTLNYKQSSYLFLGLNESTLLFLAFNPFLMKSLTNPYKNGITSLICICHFIVSNGQHVTVAMVTVTSDASVLFMNFSNNDFFTLLIIIDQIHSQSTTEDHYTILYECNN